MLSAFPKHISVFTSTSVWAKGREERKSTTKHGWGNSRLWVDINPYFGRVTQQNLVSVQCFLQAHPLELTEKEHNKQRKEIPNPAAGKQILKPFWSQSCNKLQKYLYQAPWLVSVKFLVNGCRDQNQKLFLKVARKQGKENLGINFLH